MDGFERHEFRQDRTKVLAALAELPLVTYHLVSPDPAPDVTDYSVVSRGAARVRTVDEVRANAEAWEAQSQAPGAKLKN